MKINSIQENKSKEFKYDPVFKSYWIYRENGRILSINKVDRYIRKIAFKATLEKNLNTVKNFIKKIFNK